LGAGLLILAWLGRLCGGAVFVGGPYYLFVPPPTSALRGPGAALLCLFGITIIVCSEIAVAYLALFRTARTQHQRSEIVTELLRLLGGAGTIIKKFWKNG
jgi:hypothetical protein